MLEMEGTFPAGVGQHLGKMAGFCRIVAGLSVGRRPASCEHAADPTFIPWDNPPKEKEMASGEGVVAPVPYAARGGQAETDFTNAQTTECTDSPIDIGQCVVWNPPGADRGPTSNTGGAGRTDSVPTKGTDTVPKSAPAHGGSSTGQASPPGDEEHHTCNKGSRHPDVPGGQPFVA